MDNPSNNNCPTNVIIESDSISNGFDEIQKSLLLFKQTMQSMQGQFKLLEKNVKKELKGLKKDVDKNKNKGNRKPSGFAKPSKVSNELCKFMNRPEGSEIARTEVTQYLIKYIKEHSLQCSDNKKKIIPDESLVSLFGDTKGEEITFFNIQRLMNKHFVSSN